MPIVRRLPLMVGLCGGLLGSNAAIAGQASPVPLTELARGAEVVVVGRVAAVEGQWQGNEFVDSLIVSVVRVLVNETLKGAAPPAVDVEVEGGTIGDITLHVSD